MRTTVILFLAMLSASAMALVHSTWAQSRVTWADIDCSQSKLVGPPGLRCRATELINGSSDAKFSDGAGKGQFRNWVTFGSNRGVKLYYVGREAIGNVSWEGITEPLENEIQGWSSYAKGGRQFTQPAPLAGGDYVRFIGVQGDACVAIRKPGPVQFKGYKWVVLVNKCVPAGQQISDQDIGQLIATADFLA